VKQDEASRAGVGSPRIASRYLAQVAAATMLVAVCPTAIVWWLRACGLVDSYLLGATIGVLLSLGAAQLGRAFWQTREGSQHLLFSELLAWGFAQRLYRERKLRSARAVLGRTGDAQRRIDGGLSAEHQVKLLEEMARAMDASDPNTHGHSRRVARYSWIIAGRMGLPREQVDRIRAAAAVHDLGKIETPTEVLRKPGKLTEEEYETIKRHAADGARMVTPLNDAELTAMVRHHHERLDGSGYPDRLLGDQIPVGARIIAVADTFDSITAHRPYRAARPHKEALDVLAAEAGTKLDADAVKAFAGHYAGRRPLAFFSSLSTVPERLLAELSNGLGGIAGTAKMVAVAALVGNFAAGTAGVAAPTPVASSRAPRSPTLAESSAAEGTRASAGQEPGARTAQARASARAAGGAADGSSQVGTSSPTQAGFQPASGAAAANAAGGGAAVGSDASGRGGSSSSGGASGDRGSSSSEHGRAGDGSSAGGGDSATGPGGSGSGSSGSGGKSDGSAEGGHAHAPSLTGAVEGVKGKAEEKVKAIGEGVKGTVEDAKGKVEEVKGKAEEKVKEVGEATKGAVEEAKGKVEEVKGKVEGKVEETKGKLEKIVGKL
jgi:hypothetical protein